jgi:VanZ family protein
MTIRQRAVIFAALALIYLGAMFLGTHLPLGGEGGELPVAGADKLIHALMYAGLAGLLLAAVRLLRPPNIAAAVCVVLLIAAYAAIDEQTQSWVPTRSADPWDWGADVAGASLGAIVFLIVVRMGGGKPADGN